MSVSPKKMYMVSQSKRPDSYNFSVCCGENSATKTSTGLI